MHSLDYPICGLPLLNMKEYIDSVNACFSIDADRSYKRTHESSKMNKFFGKVSVSYWRIPAINIPSDGPRIFHPHEPYSMGMAHSQSITKQTVPIIALIN